MTVCGCIARIPRLHRALAKCSSQLLSLVVAPHINTSIHGHLRRSLLFYRVVIAMATPAVASSPAGVPEEGSKPTAYGQDHASVQPQLTAVLARLHAAAQLAHYDAAPEADAAMWRGLQAAQGRQQARIHKGATDMKWRDALCPAGSPPPVPSPAAQHNMDSHGHPTIPQLRETEREVTVRLRRQLAALCKRALKDLLAYPSEACLAAMQTHGQVCIQYLLDEHSPASILPLLDALTAGAAEVSTIQEQQAVELQPLLDKLAKWHGKSGWHPATATEQELRPWMSMLVTSIEAVSWALTCVLLCSCEQNSQHLEALLTTLEQGLRPALHRAPAARPGPEHDVSLRPPLPQGAPKPAAPSVTVPPYDHAPVPLRPAQSTPLLKTPGPVLQLYMTALAEVTKRMPDTVEEYSRSSGTQAALVEAIPQAPAQGTAAWLAWALDVCARLRRSRGSTGVPKRKRDLLPQLLRMKLPLYGTNPHCSFAQQWSDMIWVMSYLEQLHRHVQAHVRGSQESWDAAGRVHAEARRGWEELPADRLHRANVALFRGLSPLAVLAVWMDTDQRHVLVYPRAFPQWSMYHRLRAVDTGDFNAKMEWRQKLVQWLSNLRLHHGLRHVVLHDAIAIMDAHIAACGASMNQSEVQLLALTSLCATARVHHVPEDVIAKFQALAPNYHADSYAMMEENMSKTLMCLYSDLPSNSCSHIQRAVYSAPYNVAHLMSPLLPSEIMARKQHRQDEFFQMAITRAARANEQAEKMEHEASAEGTPVRERHGAHMCLLEVLKQSLGVVALHWQLQRIAPLTCAVACICSTLRDFGMMGLYCSGSRVTSGPAAHPFMTMLCHGLHVDMCMAAEIEFWVRKVGHSTRTGVGGVLYAHLEDVTDAESTHSGTFDGDDSDAPADCTEAWRLPLDEWSAADAESSYWWFKPESKQDMTHKLAANQRRWSDLVPVAWSASHEAALSSHGKPGSASASAIALPALSTDGADAGGPGVDGDRALDLADPATAAPASARRQRRASTTAVAVPPGTAAHQHRHNMSVEEVSMSDGHDGGDREPCPSPAAELGSDPRCGSMKRRRKRPGSPAIEDIAPRAMPSAPKGMPCAVGPAVPGDMSEVWAVVEDEVDRRAAFEADFVPHDGAGPVPPPSNALPGVHLSYRPATFDAMVEVELPCAYTDRHCGAGMLHSAALAEHLASDGPAPAWLRMAPHAGLEEAPLVIQRLISDIGNRSLAGSSSDLRHSSVRQALSTFAPPTAPTQSSRGTSTAATPPVLPPQSPST